MKTPHSALPRHCGTCGEDWPTTRPLPQSCRVCGGLSCRADTTDDVAPDPPCSGSGPRLRALATRANQQLPAGEAD